MRTLVCTITTATLLLFAGCSPTHGPGPGTAGPPGAAATGGPASGRAAPPTPTPPAPAEPTDPAGDPGAPHPIADPDACATGTGWDCAAQRRLADADANLRRSAGQLAIVVRDRVTGGVWRSGATGRATRAAATIRLAVAAAVLEGRRAGRLTLSAVERTALATMLTWASNDATTLLWNLYGAADLIDRFRTAYGMSGLATAPDGEPSWRSLTCTAEDLHSLMTYVLGHLHPTDRAYLVGAARGVAGDQHWGVWAAGPALRPGVVNGATNEEPTGVTHSVGFAGPGERYAVAVTYELPAGASLTDGVRTVSTLVAIAFGAPTPAPLLVDLGRPHPL